MMLGDESSVEYDARMELEAAEDAEADALCKREGVEYDRIRALAGGAEIIKVWDASTRLTCMGEE
ncbi:hypothetical protein LCGC14_3036240 [marine sediment metagenome]|uniref:Uncharacterized protein n=1 Tax=marine sediment metagenome TaxID=412755 RepID=A0A0F8ZGX5_9ZZZZ